MKGNKLMKIMLPSGIEVSGLHKSEEINLTELWGQSRILAKRYNANMTSWLASEGVEKFIKETQTITNTKSVVRVAGAGNKKVTWCHINVAIAAMMYLDPAIQAQVVDEFVKGRIFEWRDKGGDGFIDLNAVLVEHAMEVLGKPAHKGHFIHIAKTLKTKVGAETWDTASADMQRKRAQLEDRLATLLKAGVVKDWDHLKDLAERV